jgi:hypothetical protein
MMNPASTSAAGRQIGIGILLVSFVTLVTFVFSFVGTILCGALVGMMVGFSQQWRWRFVLISLVFPVALLASLHVSKADLSVHDNALLALVCFGAFWGTYLLTRGLSYLERKGARPPAAPSLTAAKTLAAAESKPAACDPSDSTAVIAASPVAVQAPQSTGLEELQGTWWREASAPDGKPCRKVIEIAREGLALSLVDRAGKVRFLARGDATLEMVGTFKMVKVSHWETRPSAFPDGELGLPDKWIYRVLGDNLTVAVDFEEAAAGRKPLVETYVKSRNGAGAVS